MNATQLQPLPPLQAGLQRVSVEAAEKDADFVVLRLLNKRARVRLSPGPLDLEALPGKGRLFTVANSIGCFAAVVRHADGSYQLVYSRLADLRSAFLSTPNENNEIELTPKTRISLSGVPATVDFAMHDSRLIVGLVQGSILVYDTQSLLMQAQDTWDPIHVFLPHGESILAHAAPNPGDIPELIAVLRRSKENVNDSSVEVLDVRTMKSVATWQCGNTSNSRPTALSWSPKGKQLALGLESGDIVTYSPSDSATIKSLVPKPQSLGNDSVVFIQWLSNSEFYCIFAPPGPLVPDSDQKHFIVSSDMKANTAKEVTLNPPYLPFPGLRPPGQFAVSLRNWGSTRFIIFVGDSTSSDIGLIGSLEDSTAALHETWHNLSLEETSTPSVPLDRDMNDTVLLALELDLTNTQIYHYTNTSGEESDIPPPPILYAYASDGTVISWQIIHTQGTPYPGMIGATSTVSESPEAETRSVSSTTLPSAHGNPTSPLPFTSHLSSPAQTPLSAREVSSTSTTLPRTFASPGVASSGAFAAFSNSGPAKFGQAGFNLTSSSEKALVPEPLEVNTTPLSPVSSIAEDDGMDSDAEDSITGLSLGTRDPSQSTAPRGTSSMFGISSTATSPSVSTDRPVSNSGFSGLKPAVGFGAFAQYGSATSGSAGSSSGSAFTAPGVVPQPHSSFGKPAFEQKPAFGQTGFAPGSLAKPSFGQPAFGQPAFGQPAFGQTAFAQPAFGRPTSGQPHLSLDSHPPPITASSSKPISGGFGAFAQSGPATFSSVAAKPDDKAVWVSQSAQEPDTGEKDIPAPQTTESDANPNVNADNSIKSSQNPETGSSEEAAKARTDVSDVVEQSPHDSTATGNGAFAQLKTSPFGFGHVAAGFGAFGGSDMSSSPFFKAAKASESPSSHSFTSVLPVPITTPPKGDATKPVFGASSVIGNVRSAFASTPNQSPSKIPASSGGFAAFSGIKSGFGASPNASKSFGELLRQKPTEDDESAALDSRIESRPGSSRPGGSRADLDEHDILENLLESDSEDDAGFFLSDSEESESDQAEDVSTEESRQDVAEAVHPAQLTQTPQKYLVTPQTSSAQPGSESPAGEGKHSSSAVRAASTTPPGSPASKLPATSPQTLAPSLSPVPNLQSLGIGRPSTRPARSSPLANDPINGDDDHGEDVLDQESRSPTDSRLVTPASRNSSPSLKRNLEPELSTTSRPKTPPLLSTFGSALPPKPAPFSIVPSEASTGAFLSHSKGSAPSPSASTAHGGLFTPPMGQMRLAGAGLPLTSVSSSASATSPVSPLLSPSAKGKQPAAVHATSGSPLPSSPLVAPLTGPANQQTNVPQGRPVEVNQRLAEGMQSECANLVVALSKELEEVHRVAQDAHRKTQSLHQTTVGGEPENWRIRELPRLRQIMQSAEKEVISLEGEKAARISSIRELESHLLKANTRKEEISRFSRASRDPEFARMLKARTLGPEHLETQSQLRRDIRMLRDRIQYLEDQIQASKRKLSQMRAGKTGLKPPSLDTINRIYRNIDLAIAQQEDDVAQLTARAAKLSVKPTRDKHKRDGRLPKEAPRLLEVTPSVAMSTAAALNAELSAHKLKRALMAARKEPTLNVQTASMPLQADIRSDVPTPVKLETMPAVQSERAYLSRDQSSMPTAPPALDAAFTQFPDVSEEDTSHSPRMGSRHRTMSGKHHAKPVPLKKASPGGVTPKPTFDWGPLPGVTPMKTLSVDVRKTPPQPVTPPSLSSSWVTENFAEKK